MVSKELTAHSEAGLYMSAENPTALATTMLRSRAVPVCNWAEYAEPMIAVYS